jgi:peptide/nickel transport system permease protein
VSGYLVKRILWAGALFLVLTFVTYILFFVVPSGANTGAAGRAQSGQEVATLRAVTGIHGSFVSEYGQFLRNIFRGSLGSSFENRRDVIDVIANAAPITASLVIGGAVIWLLISIPLGILSAVRPRSLSDRAGTIFVLAGMSAHPAWIGLVLAYFFSYRLHLVPLTGYCDFFRRGGVNECGGPIQWAYHLLLPWLTFAMLFAALYTRMIRATVTEALNEDYVLTARAKGASEWHVLRKHVLHNAFLPITTMLGMDLGIAMGNAFFVEKVYGLPGIGRTVLNASVHKDLPVLVGVVVFITTAIVVFNLIADLLYRKIDPRIDLAEGGIEAKDRQARAVRRRRAVSVRGPDPSRAAP